MTSAHADLDQLAAVRIPEVTDSSHTIIEAPFEFVSDCSAMGKSVTGNQRRFTVAVARDHALRSAAHTLINSQYAKRGYLVEDTTAPRGRATPDGITLVASEGNRPLGTISVNIDSEAGLLVDEVYGHEVGLLRAASRRPCEFVKFAVSSEAESKRMLAALFHLSTIYCRMLCRQTDILVEVNPRHINFYKRALGFRAAGPERLNPRVDAPCRLLRLDLDYGMRQIKKLAGRADPSVSERSLYPYFFPPALDTGITQRFIELMDGTGGQRRGSGSSV